MTRTFRILGTITFLTYGLVMCAQTAKTTGAHSKAASKSAAPKAATKKAPAHSTDPASKNSAIIETTAGNMRCKLFDDAAPNGVANFIGLATGTKEWKEPLHGKPQSGVPLYNGTIFHRVIPNFMIQGGDPRGDGTGYIGYSFDNEVVPGLTFDRAGRLAYANTGLPHSQGSQFFITETAVPDLNGGYTIFGQCDAATVALVKNIARRARDTRPGPTENRPYDPVKIKEIKIVPATKTPGRTPRPTKKPAATPGGTISPGVTYTVPPAGGDKSKPGKPPVRFLGPPVKKPGS